MTTTSVPSFKPSAALLQRIDGHYQIDEFIALVTFARNFLGSTKLFGTSYKIELSNQLYQWTNTSVLIKNEAFDNDPYLTQVMYLPPSDSSGLKNFCPWATEGCRKVCLGVGSGRMNHGYDNLNNGTFNWTKDNTAKAQLKRAELFVMNERAFIAQMIVEIHAHATKAANKGIKAATRPNGSSDILWEHRAPQIFEIFNDCQFYDYTKAPLNTRINKPQNYHLTYSRAETKKNQDEAQKYVNNGFNAAVVFATEKHNLPDTFLGMPVIDGDIHDMRFKDQRGVYVGLAAKGAAKHDNSGFVVKIN